jgi:hypothetical protein
MITHEEIIELVKAHKEGKKIQTRRANIDKDWFDPDLNSCTELITYLGIFNKEQVFRIKPEPRRWWIVETKHQGDHVFMTIGAANSFANNNCNKPPIEVMEVL